MLRAASAPLRRRQVFRDNSFDVAVPFDFGRRRSEPKYVDTTEHPLTQSHPSASSAPVPALRRWRRTFSDDAAAFSSPCDATSAMLIPAFHRSSPLAQQLGKAHPRASDMHTLRPVFECSVLCSRSAGASSSGASSKKRAPYPLRSAAAPSEGGSNLGGLESKMALRHRRRRKERTPGEFCLVRTIQVHVRSRTLRTYVHVTWETVQSGVRCERKL